MKAGIVFTGSGPILILTSYPRFDDPEFQDKLTAKGIKKFIAYEIPLNLVVEKYGAHYTAIINDVQQTDDLRVLDYNGYHVFHNFDFSDMRNPIYCEPMIVAGIDESETW